MVDVHGSLPDGWSVHFNEEYRHWYYHERATGRTQWEHPRSSNASPESAGQQTSSLQRDVAISMACSVMWDAARAEGAWSTEYSLQPLHIRTLSLEGERLHQVPHCAILVFVALP